MPSSMPISSNCFSAACEGKWVVVDTRAPEAVSSNVYTMRIWGMSGLFVPSGFANPSRTSNPRGASTAVNSQ